MDRYDWAVRDRFVNRSEDLAELERWWSDPTRDALAMIGRRRVGKSWLFRQFADGKPAVILVADRLLLAQQMRRFSDELEPAVGVRPALSSVAELVRVLYALGREQKILAIVDEFPFLLPEGETHDGVLTEVQAVMEEHRDGSQTKLVLCGSLIGQMEKLLYTSSPLHGRLRQFDVWPFTFPESKMMTAPTDSAERRITRYAVAGGMARYLSELGHDPLRQAVCQRVLDRRAFLFDDPRAVLEQEFRNPTTYFSLLQALVAPTSTSKLTDQLQMDSSTLAPYLTRLRDARLIASPRPVGTNKNSRQHKHHITDGFIRFWFRFVLGHQDDLQQGLEPQDMWHALIEPHLAEFVAPAFEVLCQRYTRRVYGAEAPTVGGWWGPALNKYRRAGTRQVEEVDVVGVQHRRLKVVGECKWTAGRLPFSVLNDLREYKIPAIQKEGGLTPPTEGPRVLLFSRSGFNDALQREADSSSLIELIGLDALVEQLDQP
jgi:uncharacterized protein